MIRTVGLIKTTLNNYPGKVACALFLHGCNLQCPYCHNPALVTGAPPESFIPLTEVFTFLHKRKNILGGVAISGGEPFLNHAILKLAQDIKALGLPVKIDTNGTFPERLKECPSNYVALDIKTPFDKYHRVTPDPSAGEKVLTSARFLIKEAAGRFEFRTTMVPGIITPAELAEIAQALQPEVGKKSSEVPYILQKFNPHETLDQQFSTVSPYSEKEMKKAANILQKAGFKVIIR